MQYLEVAEPYEFVDFRQERPQRLWMSLCCNVSGDCSNGRYRVRSTGEMEHTIVVLDLVPYTGIDVLWKMFIYDSAAYEESVIPSIVAICSPGRSLTP